MLFNYSFRLGNFAPSNLNPVFPTGISRIDKNNTDMLIAPGMIKNGTGTFTYRQCDYIFNMLATSGGTSVVMPNWSLTGGNGIVLPDGYSDPVPLTRDITRSIPIRNSQGNYTNTNCYVYVLLYNPNYDVEGNSYTNSKGTISSTYFPQSISYGFDTIPMPTGLRQGSIFSGLRGTNLTNVVYAFTFFSQIGNDDMYSTNIEVATGYSGIRVNQSFRVVPGIFMYNINNNNAWDESQRQVFWNSASNYWDVDSPYFATANENDIVFTRQVYKNRVGIGTDTEMNGGYVKGYPCIYVPVEDISTLPPSITLNLSGNTILSINSAAVYYQ